MHIKNSFLIKQFDNVPKKYNGLLFEKIGLLVTERYSIIIKGIIIYLDKNYYNGQIDYEIEIEFINKYSTICYRCNRHFTIKR